MKKKADLHVEYVSIDEVQPYEGNAKEHPEEQVEQIAESIRQFGFNDPLAIADDGTIIEGHGRFLAAQLMGLKTVPVIRLGHLTDEQRRAYTLVHNQLTMNSGFDFDALEAELASIESIDMSAFDLEIPEDAGEAFSMEDLEPVEGYDAENDERPYFESAFTFPTEHKAAIVSYLKINKPQLTQAIIEAAIRKGGGGA